MAWDDEDKAYRTYDDIVSRSIRRGTKKGLIAAGSAIIGGLLFHNPAAIVGSAIINLLVDAAAELPEAVSRSEEDD